MQKYKLLPDQLIDLTMLEIIMMGVELEALQPQGTQLSGIQGIRAYFKDRSKMSPVKKLQELLGRER